MGGEDVLRGGSAVAASDHAPDPPSPTDVDGTEQSAGLDLAGSDQPQPLPGTDPGAGQLWQPADVTFVFGPDDRAGWQGRYSRRTLAQRRLASGSPWAISRGRRQAETSWRRRRMVPTEVQVQVAADPGCGPLARPGQLTNGPDPQPQAAQPGPS